MSFEQYSPLDTTLPFFSNHVEVVSDTTPEFRFSFLLKLKAVARRIKITNASGRALSIYFNEDRSNPAILAKNANTAVTTSRTFNQWSRSVRIVLGPGSNFASPYEVEYDAVPVQYLPPRDRV